VLLRTPAADSVEKVVFARGETLHAPHLIDLEVAQVLRRYARDGLIDDQRARQALDDLAALPLIRYPHDVLIGRIWELRHNLTAYDAAYVALAEILPAVLITRDARLGSARGHRARIRVVES